MRTTISAFTAVLACSGVGVVYGAITGAAFGTVLVPLFGTIYGLFWGAIAGFIAATVGASLISCKPRGAGGFIGGLAGGSAPAVLMGSTFLNMEWLALPLRWLLVCLPCVLGAGLGAFVSASLQRASAPRDLPLLGWLRRVVNGSALRALPVWQRGVVGLMVLGLAACVEWLRVASRIVLW